ARPTSGDAAIPASSTRLVKFVAAIFPSPLCREATTVHARNNVACEAVIGWLRPDQATTLQANI
ncbi:MAG: hypothetical protein WBD11_02125, partial [Xanthobacteraceae bacterium]